MFDDVPIAWLGRRVSRDGDLRLQRSSNPKPLFLSVETSKQIIILFQFWFETKFKSISVCHTWKSIQFGFQKIFTGHCHLGSINLFDTNGWEKKLFHSASGKPYLVCWQTPTVSSRAQSGLRTVTVLGGGGFKLQAVLRPQLARSSVPRVATASPSVLPALFANTLTSCPPLLLLLVSTSSFAHISKNPCIKPNSSIC